MAPGPIAHRAPIWYPTAWESRIANAEGSQVERLIHECVDNEEWHLTSRLTPEKCAERLRSALRSSFVEIGRIDQQTVHFEGSVSDRSFRIKFGIGSSTFVAIGQMSPSPSGSNISVEVTHTSEGWVFAGIVALIPCVLLGHALPTPGIGQALLFLLGVAGLIALPIYWLWEKKRLVDFICAWTEATPTRVALASPKIDW
jgi:hypothetical protein